jgi:hypothetical protein
MKYSPLKDKSDQDSQPSEDYEALLSNNETAHQKALLLKVSLISAIIIPIASFCLFGFGVWIGSKWLANPNDICPSHVQHYCKLNLWCSNMTHVLITLIAPILKEVDTSIHTVQFNGSLLKENIFRQDAGPEVDAAWASLGVHCKPPRFLRLTINYDPKTYILLDRSLAVPSSEAAKAGLKPDQVQINDKYGGGFPANVEGLHHLHCLV